IGTWLDEDGNGRPDVLVVETRNMKGPRTLDSNGIPLASDNKTIVRERLFLDRANPDILHDEVITIDSALTRPWTVRRSYTRSHHVVWPQNICAEDNHHAEIGKESYFVSDDGYLMPTRKDQPPPDLRLFGAAAKCVSRQAAPAIQAREPIGRASISSNGKRLRLETAPRRGGARHRQIATEQGTRDRRTNPLQQQSHRAAAPAPRIRWSRNRGKSESSPQSRCRRSVYKFER